MYIIVVGAGRIGESLVKIAAERGHNTVIVDKDEDRCSEITEKYDIMAICGDSTIRSILEDAGARRADALAATTKDDAVNLLTVLVGKELKIQSLVSLVSQPEHALMFRRIGANVMENPASAVAEYLYRILQRPSIRDFMSIGGGEAEIFEIVVTDKASVVDKTLDSLRLAQKDALIVAITRDDEIIIPRGDTIIMEGDRVTVFVLAKKIEETTKLFTG
ncbi:MAG: TrkA family potassium uptake protein [Theionarchaea archaeon]|nr:TrkA family potassium uptake protein [Theionarchaea archaeon]MBU7037596.1 TrkA family potassium uptake protein [Theionarchaea archaeon]